MTKNITHIIDPTPYGQNADAYMTDAQLRVMSAYAALFTGNGTQDDADLVLVDLASFSRYYDTTSLSASAHEAQALNQRRAVMTRVLTAMAKAGVEPNRLMTATLSSPPYDEPISPEEGL